MSSEPPVPPCIPGDVQLISILQGNFAAIAAAAAQSKARLLNAGGQIVWTGAAHDAFEGALKDVPYDLGKVNASFGRAASALATYVKSLAEQQAQYSSKVKQFVPLWDQCDTLQHQWQQLQPGLFGGQPSAEQKSQMEHLQSRMDSLKPELESLYQSLQQIYGDACRDADRLANALDSASNAGIQDSLSNTVGRYGGDVVGFVGGVVTGLVHDIGELVTAIVNFEEMEAKLIDDLARGDWSAAGKDIDQMVEDVDQICKAVSGILMTLTPILQFIPGVGEIVDVLDIIAVVASVATVATDAAMIGLGGTAVDPLTGEAVNLRQTGESNILGDSLSVVLSLAPGGGGVTDDAADDAATDAIKEGQDVDDATEAGESIRQGEDVETAMDKAGGDASFAGPGREPTAMEEALQKAFADSPESDLTADLQQPFEKLQAMYDTPVGSQLSDITDYRQVVSGEIAKREGLWVKNPTVFNHLGVKLSYRTFQRISAVTKGGELGYAAHGAAAQPSGDNADAAFGAGATAVGGALPV